MAVIDVTTFNGEYELWDIHYNVLKDHVDEFIVCEAKTTFSGQPKLLSFNRRKYPQVKYHVIDENWTDEELALAQNSPNTVGAEHWKREFLQKESIKKALTHLKDDDIVFIGDVDEVWDPSSIYLGVYRGGFKLPLRVYTYYLNNRSTELFWGTYMGYYRRDIKGKCLNHLRSDSYKLNPDLAHASNYCGWHFTSMGGPVSLKKKLTDSYTQESYATHHILDNLEYNIQNGRDFLDRPFTYKVDESQWPTYLRENRAKYKHLCAPQEGQTQQQSVDSASPTSEPQEEEPIATVAEATKSSKESSTTYTKEEPIGNV